MLCMDRARQYYFTMGESELAQCKVKQDNTCAHGNARCCPLLPENHVHY